MQPLFDPLAYAGYVRQRWRFVALSCFIAVAVALSISLMVEKKYTAKASLLIDPPGNADARMATAVSPVYLESLKSYEHFASSDTLFRRALDKFHLRSGGASIESMKRRVLKVSKLRDTRILELSVTLPDPKQAQALAQFLAEQTLRLNEDLLRAGDNDSIAAALADETKAKSEAERQQTALAEFVAKEPAETLESEMKSLTASRGKVREELMDARVALAGDEQRLAENPGWKAAAAASRARVSALQSQSETLDRELERKNALLGKATAKRQLLESLTKSAETAYETTAARAREMRSASGSRGERLRIIDPGIVPEGPSSPNVPLNLVIAFVAAAVFSLLYLGVAFQSRPALVRTPLRSTATHANG
jgi:uncharacterized protein involved in exopolysaccharide biosynthesis